MQKFRKAETEGVGWRSTVKDIKRFGEAQCEILSFRGQEIKRGRVAKERAVTKREGLEEGELKGVRIREAARKRG